MPNDHPNAPHTQPTLDASSAPDLTQYRLRTDLLITTQQNRGDEVFVLKDPNTNKYYKLGQVEYFIASQLDNQATYEQIRQRTQQRFDADLDPESAYQFIDQLGSMNLIEYPGQPTTPTEPTNKRPPLRGNLLYLRFKAFDPDKLLDRLLPTARLLINPTAVTLSIALMLVALAIFCANAQQITWELTSLYQIQSAILVWATIILVTVGHEFAHGLTCKHFTGRVNEMGFMLLYFQPALYCNISDAWLFPEKSKRLWVTAAGAFFELQIWAIATILWRITAPGTTANYLSLILVTATAIKTFFNLNPLIKLDGYYLLSDYLEIPNLKARSSAYLAQLIRKPFNTHRSKHHHTPPPPRERRIYLLYGLLSKLFTTLLLTFIALRFGSFLTDRFQAPGFILFTGILFLMFQNPLRKFLINPACSIFRRDTPAPTRRRPIIIAAALALTLAFAYFIKLELKVAGEFTILPAKQANIRAQVQGIIQTIHVDEGDTISPGTPIAELAGNELRADLAAINAQINEAAANLQLLQAGPTAEQIQLARAELKTAQTNVQHYQILLQQVEHVHAEQLTGVHASVEKATEKLDFAKEDLTTLQELFENNAVNPRELQHAKERVAVRTKELQESRATLNATKADQLAETRTTLALAQSQLHEAKSRLDLLLAGTRPEEIQAATAATEQLQARAKHLQHKIQNLRITSPLAGTITTEKPKDKTGELVAKGDLIVQVQQSRTVTADILIPEKQIADIQLGQPVILKARAFASRQFNAHVTAIAPVTADNTTGLPETRVRVTTKLDNPDAALKPGMTGLAKIYCGKKPALTLFTQRLTRYLRVEFWSWW